MTPAVVAEAAAVETATLVADASSTAAFVADVRRYDLRWQAFAVVVSLAGGLFGLAAAFYQEVVHGASLIGAPLIEEALKPCGVYILLACWPALVRGPRHAAVLSASAGLVFGLLESLTYVLVYFPDAGDDFLLFRFTVPVSLHVVCSLIMGSGLSAGVIDWAAGRGRLPKITKQRFVIAAGLHAVYNVCALILEFTGVLRFD